MKRLFYTLLPIILLCIVSITQANTLSVKGTQFIDSGGGVVALRGWNISAKIPPYDTKATSESFDQLESWGTNVIRLSFIWEAMEAQRGTYDEAYLASMDELVDLAHERNIWVVIDIHQDSYSRYSMDGCGEGFPLWAVSGNVEEPDNGENCKDWGTRMFNDFLDDGPMQAEWQNFYANTYGVRDSYLDMIAMLAQRYSTKPAVIGIDLINEPFGEIEQIYDLYEHAAKEVHAINPDWIIFASPHAMTTGSVKVATFGERPNIDNVVLSPHYYDPTIMQFHRYQAAGRFIGEDDSAGFFGTVVGYFFPSLRDAMKTLSLMVSEGGIDIRPPEQVVADLKATADSWGVPLFIGEFGVHATAIDTAYFLDTFYGAMNDQGVSGTQWIYAPQWTQEKKDGWNQEDLSAVDSEGNVRSSYRPNPYVVRLAGDIIESDSFYEQPGQAFAKGIRLTYSHDPSKGETRIFFPALLNIDADYLDQFSVSLSSGSYSIDTRKRQVVINANTKATITAEIQYRTPTLQQNCRIYFQHNGFSCSDGISITFESAGVKEDRKIVRYADYPSDSPYDFGEWPLGNVIEITTQRNNSSDKNTQSFVVEPNMCGRIVEIKGRSDCFGNAFDLEFPN